jgi:hypothetical protein
MSNKKQGSKPVRVTGSFADLGAAFTRATTTEADLADAWETVEATREFMDSLVVRPHGSGKAYFVRDSSGKLRRIPHGDVVDHVTERRRAHRVIMAHTDWVEVEGRLMRPSDVPIRHTAERLVRAMMSGSGSKGDE